MPSPDHGAVRSSLESTGPPAGSIERAWTVHVSRVLGALLAVGSVYVVVTTLLWIVRLWHPSVFWDMWEFVDDFAAWSRGEYAVSQTWAQHNEHRILFPRLCFFVDFLFFQGRGVSLLVLTCAVQVACAAALIRQARRAGAEFGSGHAAVAFVAAFSAAQMNNLFWGFQLQFVAVYLFAVLAFGVLAKSDSWRALVGSAACATVATFSMANGVLVWPVLLLLALFLRSGRGRVITLAVIGGLVVFAYMHGYHNVRGHTDPSRALAEPLALVGFVLTYLGNPLRAYGLAPCTVLGCVGLAAFVAVAWRCVRAPRNVSRAEAGLLATCAFVVGTACVTGLGRLGLAEDMAIQSRYTTPTLVFWSALAGVLLARTRSGGWPRLATMLFFVALTAALCRQQQRMAREFEGWRNGIDRGSLALEVGSYGATALDRLFPAPGAIEHRFRFVRDHRLASCASETLDWLGQPLTARFTVDDGRLDGAVNGIHAAGPDGFLEMTGTIDVPDRSRLIVCDAAGVVVGLGRVDRAAKRGSPSRDWRAFVRPVHGEIAVFAVHDGASRAALLATGIRVPSGRVVPWVAGGTDLPGDVRVTGAFEPNCLPAGVKGAAPERFHGSGRRDGDTGSMRMGPFAASMGLVVPFRTGPNAAGQRIAIVDAANGAPLAEMLGYVASDGWVEWRLDPSQLAAASVWVDVEDRGAEWGQWSAVAWPHAP